MTIKTTDLIRWALTLLLLYGAYTETGVWTLIVLALMSIDTEARIMARREGII